MSDIIKYGAKEAAWRNLYDAYKLTRKAYDNYATVNYWEAQKIAKVRDELYNMLTGELDLPIDEDCDA